MRPAALAVLTLGTLVLASGGEAAQPGAGSMMGAGGEMMMLVVLAFWGVLIAGIVVAIRWLLAQGREPRTDTVARVSRRQRPGRAAERGPHVRCERPSSGRSAT